MQLLNFPMISILPICIFSINRTANRETTDCWRGRRQGRSLRIRRARPKAGRWASSTSRAVSVRSRDLLKRNPPPQPATPDAGPSSGILPCSDHGNQNQCTWKCTPNFDCKMTALGHPKGPHRTAKIDQIPRKCALRRCLKGLKNRNWEK